MINTISQDLDVGQHMPNFLIFNKWFAKGFSIVDVLQCLLISVFKHANGTHADHQSFSTDVSHQKFEALKFYLKNIYIMHLSNGIRLKILNLSSTSVTKPDSHPHLLLEQHQLEVLPMG